MLQTNMILRKIGQLWPKFQASPMLKNLIPTQNSAANFTSYSHIQNADSMMLPLHRCGSLATSGEFGLPQALQWGRQPWRGMKWVSRPRKRCKSCYFVVEDEILKVYCDEHPRHKQGVKMYKKKFSKILTHATQGGYHYGNGKGRMEMWTQQGMRMDF